MGITVYSLLWVMQDFDHQPKEPAVGKKTEPSADIARCTGQKLAYTHCQPTCKPRTLNFDTLSPKSIDPLNLQTPKPETLIKPLNPKPLSR